MLPENVQNALRAHLVKLDPIKLRMHLNVAAENLYNLLPSGDYGRADVRRYVEDYLRAWGFSCT
tara:strand:+ start:495 stop:686 length:192 start_codon:yes stop_codon:yes gene_type:complete